MTSLPIYDYDLCNLHLSMIAWLFNTNVMTNLQLWMCMSCLCKTNMTLKITCTGNDFCCKQLICVMIACHLRLSASIRATMESRPLNIAPRGDKAPASPFRVVTCVLHTQNVEGKVTLSQKTLNSQNNC